MTPPCSQCHGFATEPWSVSIPSELSRPGQPAPQCTATESWPEASTEDFSAVADLAWWQRSQFERARQAHRQDLGLNTLPFRVHVDRADLKLKILPQSFRKDSIQITASPNTQIDSSLRLRCNRIPLQLQGLATFTDTVVTTPVGDVTLKRLSVGDLGGVHLIAQASEPIASALNLMTPYHLPRPPLGWDATGNFLAYDQIGQCFTPKEIEAAIETCTIDDSMYENLCAVPYTFEGVRRATGLTDWPITDRLPPNTLESDGKLPHDWELEALLGKILQLLAAPGGQAEAPAFSLAPLQHLEKFIRPGSHATLKVEHLSDLFIPGVLDLGSTTGTLQVEYGADGALWIEGQNLEINGDPMDYPATLGAKRPPIRLQGFRIRTDEPRQNSLGELLAPGIRVHLDPKADRLSYEVNLSFNLDVDLPWLGAVQASGTLLASGAVTFTPEGMKIAPGDTHWELHDLNLRQEGEALPLIENTSLQISDRSPMNPTTGLFSKPLPGFGEPAPIAFMLQGQSGWGHEFDLQGHAPVPLDIFGRYQLEPWLETFATSAQFQLLSPEGISYAARLQLNRAPLSLPTGKDRSALAWELQFDLLKNSDRGPEGLLRQAALNWEWTAPQRGDDEIQGLSLHFSALQAQWDALKLNQLSAALNVEWSGSDGGPREWRIPEFRLAADASKNRRGPLRGPLSLEQKPDKTLTIAWSPEERHLSWKNLDFKIDAQKLDLVPRKTRRAIHPRIRYLGLDTRLVGDFALELPTDRKAWRGRGKLSLRGDRRGDLYWLDRYGRKVGPPLVRETRWTLRRIHKINWRRGYALGNFHLDTVLNPSSVFPQANWAAANTGTTAYGHRGQKLRPFEIQALMPYDNQPWSTRGFQSRILDYLDHLCRQDPNCPSESARKGAKK